MTEEKKSQKKYPSLPPPDPEGKIYITKGSKKESDGNARRLRLKKRK